VVSLITYEAADALLGERLSPSAAAHCRRVAQTAASLAERYRVDVAWARLAGLLHDWDRERTPEQLFSAAAAAGLAVSDADATVPYLLHARTGAAALRVPVPAPPGRPGVPDEVVTAVAHHTVGSSDMSDLDMIVYVADMIEPGREYPGVESLRELSAHATLAELFAAAYQQSILYLIGNRKRIHPDTVAVWNELVAGEQP